MQTEYRKTVDGCSRYLRRLNMPAALQRRVTCWFNYTWSQQRCFGMHLHITLYFIQLNHAQRIWGLPKDF